MRNAGQIENVTCHSGALCKDERQRLKKHKSLILWFTGLSGSGKSTLANELEKELYQQRLHTYLLDGDNLRFGLNKNLGFSEEERVENIRRIAEVGKLFVDAGIVVLVAAISPFQKERDEARTIFEKDEFIEVYVKCSIDICEQRDPKGLYKKARSGEIKNFTGISQPYEEPLKPEMIIETDKDCIDKCVKKLKAFLDQKLNDYM